MSEQETALSLREQMSPAEVDDFKAMLAYDIATSSIRSVRFPRIKVGHANQSFSLPNNKIERELNGVIIAKANFMEYYLPEDADSTELVLPDCAAINDYIGFKYGPCEKCPKYQWVEDVGRECNSSYRILLRLQGLASPVELKVSQTSISAFNTAIKPILAQQIPLVYANIKITLESKKEGSQEWSLFKFDVTVPEYNLADPEIKERLAKRRNMHFEFKDYFVKAYGMANMQPESVVPPTPSDAQAPKEQATPKSNDKTKTKSADKPTPAVTVTPLSPESIGADEEAVVTSGPDSLNGLGF